MSIRNVAGWLAPVAALIVVTAVAVSGCGGGSSSTTTGGTNGGTNGGTGGNGGFTVPGTTPFVNSTLATRDVCRANTHLNGRARWTVLVYMNAANNLQPFSLINVAQMAAVGSNADLNIVVQWKQTATSQFFTGAKIVTTPSFIGTRRYLIKQHSQGDRLKIAPTGIDTNTQLVGDTTVLDPDRLPDPPTNTINDNGHPTADMGDYKTLADFVQWGGKNFPADHLAVVVWDHGSGVLNVDNRSVHLPTSVTRSVKPLSRGLSQDVQTGTQISTQQMPLALANPPQKVDALIIDCSLQGATEMAYEVRASARVFVGSEESPPGTGYPYDVWLAFLRNNVASPCDAGRNLINDTIAEYPTAPDITQSMTDLTKMDAVATALNAFGGSLKADVRAQPAVIKTARQASQFFELIEYKDLYDFANNIRKASGVPSDLVQTAADLQTSLLGPNGAILASSRGAGHDTTGAGEDRASGLSIFLPGPETQGGVDGTVGFDPAWNQLALAKAAPNWAGFLQLQLQ